jgi:hypothetical protein
LKGAGYLTSTLSVILLAAVAWKSAVRDPVLFLCLLLGAATSVAGMFLRWKSHRLEQREKPAGEESRNEAEPRAESFGH